ncbi:Protein saal1 [Clonorchis sinensis]|uniref:Protein saal1 n=3 Tax=Clonorchis sinensis TaxID=79923 RepID=H2KQB9_CLOSI|nr:Protein saal1 [Clonorchis sinensis]GAA32013.1 protein saal1 [Clonorchis sinensis]
MSARNPSPPPDFSEELQNIDNIGDTAYSKRWLFSLLMDLLKLVRDQPVGCDDVVEELDPRIEEELCCLWDLTVNRDVVPYLEEFGVIAILTDVLLCQRYPRLLEIGVGILTNMACNSSVCQQMSDNELLINRALGLFYSRDPPTLTAVCRLVQTVLASEESSVTWLNAIRFQAEFIEHLLFILQNSTNGHLLIATIRLLDAITRGDDSLAEVWCGLDLMDAILVAQHQMRWLHGDEVEIINRLFYTFSSNITGISALIRSFDRVLPTFGIYLHKVCEDEPHLIPFSAYYNSLRAIIPVMDAVVASMPLPEAASCFSSDRTVLPCLLHVTLGCQSQLNDLPIVRGILADLNILYKDVIRTIESVLRTSTSSSEDLVTLGSWYSEDLRWITSLDSNTKVDLRGAFVNCVLNDASTETRNQLLFICNRLKLSNLLESLTDV